MTSGSLRVNTPQGDSGSVLTSADDYLFRYVDTAGRDFWRAAQGTRPGKASGIRVEIHLANQ